MDPAFLSRYDRRATRWPVNADTRMVTTFAGTTLVRVSGPIGASPVVLLHGIGGNSLHWESNVERLSREFRVHAVDAIYGCGRSVVTEPLTGAAALTRWLDELLVSLELGTGVNLIGLSFGGWLATQYALRQPERVRSLILIAPAGTVMPISARWIARAVLCWLPHPYFTRRFMHWLAADLVARDDQGRRIVDEWAADAFVASRTFRRQPGTNPTVLSRADWNELRMPVLFIVGENEKLYAASAAAARIREIAPHVSVRMFAGAGHDVSVVRADEVNESVAGFLRRAEGLA